MHRYIEQSLDSPRAIQPGLGSALRPSATDDESRSIYFLVCHLDRHQRWPLRFRALVSVSMHPSAPTVREGTRHDYNIHRVGGDAIGTVTSLYYKLVFRPSHYGFTHPPRTQGLGLATPVGSGIVLTPYYKNGPTPIISFSTVFLPSSLETAIPPLAGQDAPVQTTISKGQGLFHVRHTRRRVRSQHPTPTRCQDRRTHSQPLCQHPERSAQSKSKSPHPHYSRMS